MITKMENISLFNVNFVAKVETLIPKNQNHEILANKSVSTKSKF